MIGGINESKALTKHISCECRCKFDERKCNSDQWWNNNKCQWECKSCDVSPKDCIWNLSTCSCKNGKYLASIMDDSAITCDEVIESYNKETKTIPTNFNEKKAIWKTQIFFILLAFLFITIAFLTAVSIYCYLLCINNINEKMSNEFKDISIKNHTYYFFDDIINIKILIQIILKYMKSHTKIFLFTTLNM